MNVGDWIRSAREALSAAGFESAALEAQLLAGHVMLWDRAQLLAHPDAEFNELAGAALLERRLGHEPLAYVLGFREFFGHRFRVDSRVLIPRPETELLVDLALERSQPGARILDVGTGSGCIAISIALANPSLHVTACDLSEEALDVARMNAERLGAGVEFLHSDGYSALAGSQFDLVVSNPPYIDRSETLPREVRDYEPHLALFARENGLGVIKQLVSGLLTVQAKILLLEVGHAQAENVKGLMNRAGLTVRSHRDLLGIERVIEGECRAGMIQPWSRGAESGPRG